MRDLNADRRAGRVILVAYIASILLLLVGGLAHYLVTWGWSGAPYLFARLVLVAILSFYLYRGSRIARWLAVGVFALVGLIGLWLASRETGWEAGVNAAQAVMYLSFVVALLGSPRVHAFLAQQRASRREISGAGPASTESHVRPPATGAAPRPLPAARPRRAGLLAVLVVSAGVASAGVVAAYLCYGVAGWVEARRTYAAEYDRTREDIRALEERPPAGFDPGCWRAAVVWSHNAYCETFMYKLPADLVALARFGAGFREWAGREPGPELLEWIWDELARASPRGAFYVGKYRGDFRANLECARNPLR